MTVPRKVTNLLGHSFARLANETFEFVAKDVLLKLHRQSHGKDSMMVFSRSDAVKLM